MSIDLDLYEFKETLKKLENSDLAKLKLCEDKGVSVLEVGKNSREIDRKLAGLGYKMGEKVMVVVQ